MLCGEYRHSLDAKNRIFIPAKLREELGQTLVIAKDIRSGCLKVYSVEGWKAYIAPIKAQDRKLAEQTLRLLQASLIQVTPDSQGRVVITPALLSHAGIEKNAVIVGCDEYAEIWSEERYDRNVGAVDPAELLAALEALGL